MKYLRFMLVFLPLALLAEYVWSNPTLVFVFASLALIPLAGYLGEATEELAIHTGPKIGGLLNATLGNAAELIITIVALRNGQYALVKASITGSIFGNLLLILGASLLFGGLKNGFQRFDRANAGMQATLMLLAVIGLLIPTMFELFNEVNTGTLNLFDTEMVDPSLNQLSLWVAGILMLMYILSLVFSFRTPDRAVGGSVGVDDRTAEEEAHQAKWSVPVSLGVGAWQHWRLCFSAKCWLAQSNRWSRAWA